MSTSPDDSKSRLSQHEVLTSTGTHIQTWLLEASQPSSSSTGTTSTRPDRKLAFIAHPLGRLGGSWRDPTVQAVGQLCADQLGYDVVFVSARGCCGSGGSPSFSQIPEAEDYVSVVETYCEDHTEGDRRVTDVLLIGYSAGSLSALWCNERILDLCLRQPPKIRARRILISYPLSVMWALTLWRSSVFSQTLEMLAESQSHLYHRAATALVIYGDRDEFTSRAAYEAWSDALNRRGDGITFEELQGCNHFWLKPEHRQRLLWRIKNWIEETN